MNTRAGKFISQKSSGEEYKAFIPYKLPPTDPPLNLDTLYPLIDQAMYLSGQLNSIAHTIPNNDLFIYMSVRKEALISSQIEGTQSSLHDLLSFEHNQKINTPYDDVEEVSNYVKAINYGVKKLGDGFPLCLRLLKQIHKVLLQGTRGKQKLPGEFRTTQNWIGGTRPGNAIFVPPPPHEILDTLSELEKFVNDEKVKLPALIKIALAHVQFETIHPFLDGNGRIGRLFIILYLYKNKIITKPILYISLFLKENRNQYYTLLQDVRIHGTWETWIEFFLNGYIKTVKDSIDTIHKINSIFEEDQQKIDQLGKQKDSCIQVWNYLKKIPTATVSQLSKSLTISSPTIRSALRHMLDLDIVKLVNDKQRDKKYSYNRYLTILENGTKPIK